MDIEQLTTLIEQKENPKLEFKRQWYWNDTTPIDKLEESWSEFIKDILALTNGHPDYINEIAYLIIGIVDETKKVFTFDIPTDKQGNIYNESKLQQTLLSKLNTYAQPEFTALDVNYINVEENIIIVISVPPRGKLLSLAKDLRFKNKSIDKKGITYYRIGEDIYIASAQIHDDFSKARGENIDEIKRYIKLLGGSEEDFLKKYFGDDYRIVLENPQTYTNLKSKLLTTNTTLDTLLKEKEYLELKIKSQEFDDETHKKVEKTIHELRFSDAIDILDNYLLLVVDTKESMYQVHYLKAIVYVQNMEYQKAKEEIEFIPYLKVNDVVLLNDYAGIYKLVGNYPKAIEIYDFILSEKQKELQSNLYLFTMLYNNVAQISEKIGYMDNVERYYREALKILKDYGAEKSKEYATVLNNLGVFLNSIEYIKDALSIRQEIFGDEHIDTMQSYNNLAAYYYKVGQYTDAEKLYKNVLKFKLSHYGDFHPEVAEIYNNIAELYRKRGEYDFEQVESYYLKAIEIIKSYFGETHDLLANKFNNIGEFYIENNQLRDALAEYEKALSIYKSSFGAEEHASIATVYGNMALTYQELGNTIQSFNYHNKALDIREKILKPNDYYIGVSHANLTGFYNTLKQFSKAYHHVCIVVDIWKEILPEKHPDLLKAIETKTMLGKLYDH